MCICDFADSVVDVYVHRGTRAVTYTVKVLASWATKASNNILLVCFIEVPFFPHFKFIFFLFFFNMGDDFSGSAPEVYTAHVLDGSG